MATILDVRRAELEERIAQLEAKLRDLREELGSLEDLVPATDPDLDSEDSAAW